VGNQVPDRDRLRPGPLALLPLQACSCPSRWTPEHGARRRARRASEVWRRKRRLSGVAAGHARRRSQSLSGAPELQQRLDELRERLGQPDEPMFDNASFASFCSMTFVSGSSGSMRSFPATPRGRAASSSDVAAPQQFIALSRGWLNVRHRSCVGSEAREAIGKDVLAQVTRRCRELYCAGRASWLPRSPTRSRQLVALQVEPYLEEVNRVLCERGCGWFLQVEASYSSSITMHPRYMITVRRVPCVF
jgi:hypothetical protein